MLLDEVPPAPGICSLRVHLGALHPGYWERIDAYWADICPVITWANVTWGAAPVALAATVAAALRARPSEYGSSRDELMTQVNRGTGLGAIGADRSSFTRVP